MKRILCIVLVLLFASVCEAQQIIVMKKKAAGCSYTLKDSYGASGDSDRTPSYNYNTSSFTAESAYTLKRVELYLKQVGTAPTVSIAVKIFSDDGSAAPAVGEPETELATSTSTVLSTSVSADYTYYAFDFAGLELTSGAHYHISIPDISTNSSNAVKWYWDSGLAGQKSWRSDDKTTWASVDDSASNYFKAYSCD